MQLASRISVPARWTDQIGTATHRGARPFHPESHALRQDSPRLGPLRLNQAAEDAQRRRGLIHTRSFSPAHAGGARRRRRTPSSFCPWRRGLSGTALLFFGRCRIGAPTPVRSWCVAHGMAVRRASIKQGLLFAPTRTCRIETHWAPTAAEPRRKAWVLELLLADCRYGC